MAEKQSKRKPKEKEPVEKTHPKGCHCPKCLDRKISAIAVILDKEIQLLNDGLIQLENELNQEKQIHKLMYDFLVEHHRAELLPDNSAIVKRKRLDWIKRKIMESKINKSIRKAFGVKKRDLKDPSPFSEDMPLHNCDNCRYSGLDDVEVNGFMEREMFCEKDHDDLKGYVVECEDWEHWEESSPSQQQEAAPEEEPEDEKEEEHEV